MKMKKRNKDKYTKVPAFSILSKKNGAPIIYCTKELFNKINKI